MAIYRYILESEHFDFDYDKWETNPSVINNVESFANSLEKKYGTELDKMDEKIEKITEKCNNANTLEESIKYFDEYVNTLEEYTKYYEKTISEISENVKKFKSQGIMDTETSDIIEANLKIYKAGIAVFKYQIQFCRDNKDLIFDDDSFEESVTNKAEKAIKKFKAFIKKSSRTVKSAASKSRSMFKSIVSKFKSLANKLKKKIK